VQNQGKKPTHFSFFWKEVKDKKKKPKLLSTKKHFFYLLHKNIKVYNTAIKEKLKAEKEKEEEKIKGMQPLILSLFFPFYHFSFPGQYLSTNAW